MRIELQELKKKKKKKEAQTTKEKKMHQIRWKAETRK